VPTFSRLILHLSRLKIAVPAASLVRRGCPAPAASSGWAVGAEEARHDVDRCLLAAPGARSSRILFHLSRLMVAVPAANLVTCGCRAGQRLGSGYGWALERAVATSTAAFLLRRARARGRGAACADLLPDTGPPPARPRAAAAPPSRGRGGRALHTVCRTQRRNRRLRRRAVPGPLDALESRAKGGERRSPHPRPPTERTGPARAPRSASRIPPSKIWNRWRGAALTRTSFGGSFVCRAPSMGRTTTHPPHARRAHRGPARAPRPAPWTSLLQKVERWEKRAADARTPPTPSPSATPPPFYWVPCPGNVSTALARGGRRRFPTHGTAAPRTRSALRAPAPRLEDEEHLRVRDRRGGACLLSDTTVQPLGSV